jgi:hypothetical protein
MDVTYRGEAEWVDFDAECGDVLLLELSRQVTLDESGLLIRLLALLSLIHLQVKARCRLLLRNSRTHLASTAIADKHELESGRL